MMNNTNEIYWFTLVSLTNESIARYIMIIVWLIGNIGSILNCIIFSQVSLRKSPCGLYFLASNISQILIYNFGLLTRIFLHGFSIKTVHYEIWYCKFRFYFFYVFMAIARYNTILASIDRYFASCRDVNYRRWSSKKLAIRFIIGNIIFWCLIYIHIIIYYENDLYNCSPQKGLYQMIFSIYILIDNGILPIMFMIIFGLLTYKNVRKMKQRINPNIISSLMTRTNQLNQMNIKRKDSQFIKMLLNQIILCILLNLFNPCFLFYQAFTINIKKSFLRLEIELLLNNLSYYFIYIGFSLTFFLNLLSSSLFRNEFKRFVQIKIFHHGLTRTTTITTTELPNRTTKQNRSINRKQKNSINFLYYCIIYV